MRRLAIIALLEFLLLTGLLLYDIYSATVPTSIIQGTPYTAPAFDFDVEQGEVTSKVLLCRPSTSDIKHPDHSDRIVRLVCEDGRVVLKLNNVEFPDGFVLKVAPAR